MDNCVGKEYFFRRHLIFCYIKREKITLTKEAIFPISQFYFLLVIMMLVRMPRDLCSAGGDYSAKTKHTQVSALSFTPVIPSEMPWPGKGREAAGLAGWAPQGARHQELLPCACHAPQPVLPSFCQAPQGCCFFRGKAAVAQNGLVSHCLYIHSALLVFQSDCFSDLNKTLCELSRDPCFPVWLELELFLKCPLLVYGKDVQLYQLVLK